MKRNLFIRLSAVALLLAMIASAFIACEPLDAEEGTTEGAPAPEITTSADEPTSEAETTAEEATTAPEVTAEQTTEAPAVAKDYVVTPGWFLGYVGSDTNSSYPEKLNKTGGYYSFSDVINLGPAGSTITFTDDNTNANGDTNFASAAAYVFSSWKKSNGTWELDKSGYKANGTMALYTDDAGARTYTYTSEKDNECIRLCFRSGQTNSFTPAAYPVVTVNSTKEPVVELDDPNAGMETTAPAAPSGTALG